MCEYKKFTSFQKEVIEMKGLLLERLAKKENVFISDLKYPDNQELTLLILKTFSPASYTVKEWNYVLEYILDQSFSFKTHQEITEFLDSHLKI